jgi:hypothetical protein
VTTGWSPRRRKKAALGIVAFIAIGDKNPCRDEIAGLAPNLPGHKPRRGLPLQTFGLTDATSQDF